jgi:hypothetical protein
MVLNIFASTVQKAVCETPSHKIKSSHFVASKKAKHNKKLDNSFAKIKFPGQSYIFSADHKNAVSYEIIVSDWGV